MMAFCTQLDDGDKIIRSSLSMDSIKLIVMYLIRVQPTRHLFISFVVHIACA